MALETGCPPVVRYAPDPALFPYLTTLLSGRWLGSASGSRLTSFTKKSGVGSSDLLANQPALSFGFLDKSGSDRRAKYLMAVTGHTCFNYLFPKEKGISAFLAQISLANFSLS
jgi:hypothetical protein